jgi:hypothetical protein
VHKKALLLVLISVIAFDFTGCVSMDAQTRREHAYRRYVAKQMKKRQKEMARAQKAANREMKLKMKNVQPSEPHVTTSVQEVAEYPSVFQPVAEAPQPPAQNSPQPVRNFKEPTVDPITVSASASYPADSGSTPEQP